MKLARFSSILSTSVKNTIIKLSVQWLSNLCTLSAPPFFSLWIINPYESCHHDRDRLWNCLIMLTQVVTSFGDFCFFLQHLFKDNCKLLDVTEQIQLLAMRRQVPEARGVHPQWAGKKGIHQPCYQPWGWSQDQGEEIPALFPFSFPGGPSDKSFCEMLLLGEGQGQESQCHMLRRAGRMPKWNILTCMEDGNI